MTLFFLKKSNQKKDSKEKDEKSAANTEQKNKKKQKSKEKEQKNEEKKEKSGAKTERKTAETTKEDIISIDLGIPLEQNIESMFLDQISKKIIRSKNDLWKLVEEKLSEVGITVETDQIQEVFEKLRKEKKIGFDSKEKPVGWKLKNK